MGPQVRTLRTFLSPRAERNLSQNQRGLSPATLPLHQPCIQHPKTSRSHPKLSTSGSPEPAAELSQTRLALGVCWGSDQPCTSWGAGQSQERSVCPGNTCWVRERRGSPLLELRVEDPVGESLAADADPLQDTVTPQLVQHQEGIHGSWGGGHTWGRRSAQDRGNGVAAWV